MPEIPLTFTGLLNIQLQCGSCHQTLEAAIMVIPENNYIIISVETDHACKLETKIIQDKLN